jgi:hypothetical protein
LGLQLTIGGGLGFRFQFVQPLFRGADPGLELLSLKEAVLVCVDQSSDSTTNAPGQPRELLRRPSSLPANAA